MITTEDLAPYLGRLRGFIFSPEKFSAKLNTWVDTILDLYIIECRVIDDFNYVYSKIGQYKHLEFLDVISLDTEEIVKDIMKLVISKLEKTEKNNNRISNYSKTNKV